MAEQSEVEAVVFDFGGVITTSSPFDAVRRMAADVGVDPDVAITLVFGPYDEDTDHPWHRAERGELDIGATREAIRELSEAEVGVPIDLFDLLVYMADGGTGVRAEVVDRVRRLGEQGVRTGLLTNNLAEFREHWMRVIDDDLFDDIIDSSAVGLRKPDARIYQLSLERLGGVAPQRTVFVDDWPGNVAAARSLGMRGIVVDLDPSAALAELDAIFAW